MIKLGQFNSILNPSDKAIYVPLYNKKPNGKITYHTLKEIADIANTDPNLEIGMFIPKGFVVLNIDDKKGASAVLEIIEDRQEPVMVVETPNGIHIYASSGLNINTKNNVLNLGVKAGVLTEDIGKTYIVTPFKNPTINTNARLNDYEVIYYNGIGVLPNWLLPMYNSDSLKKRVSAISIPLDNSTRNEALLSHLTSLKFTRLNAGERAEIIELINDYLCINKLSDDDLYTEILAHGNDDTLPPSAFFNDKKFLHWKMGDYMLEYTNAKKDNITKKLYYYSDKEKKYDCDMEYLKGIITKLVPALRDTQKNEVIKHMESKLSLSTVKFNQQPYMINFKNGVLDLKNLKLYPHSPEFLDSIQLNVNYVAHEHHKTADKFFNDATCGDKDVETLLYEALGYGMLKTSNLETIFILVGGGRNGKSTYLNLIREIIGRDNSTSIDFKEMTKDFGTGDLVGKLVSLAGDISNQRLDDSDMIKKLASGDLISINQKYEKKFSAVPFTTFYLSANKLPSTPDTTFGFYRKLCVIPFNADLTKVSRTEGAFFQEELLSERSKEYIAYKAVLAIHRVLEEGEFTEPQVVVDMKKSYRMSNSTVLQWLNIRKITRDNIHSHGANLYRNYAMWCENHGHRKKAIANFVSEVEEELNVTYNPVSTFFSLPNVDSQFDF